MSSEREDRDPDKVDQIKCQYKWFCLQQQHSLVVSCLVVWNEMKDVFFDHDEYDIERGATSRLRCGTGRCEEKETITYFNAKEYI